MTEMDRFDEIKKGIIALKQSNAEAQDTIVHLMYECEHLRKERDFLQALLDQPGGRG